LTCGGKREVSRIVELHLRVDLFHHVVDFVCSHFGFDLQSRHEQVASCASVCDWRGKHIRSMHGKGSILRVGVVRSISSGMLARLRVLKSPGRGMRPRRNGSRCGSRGVLQVLVAVVFDGGFRYARCVGGKAPELRQIPTSRDGHSR
jgi:hypothetical protein